MRNAYLCAQEFMQSGNLIPKIHRIMNEGLYLNRSMESVITEAAQYFSVISVTGPRQSGKSTLLKHLFPQYCRQDLRHISL